MQDMGAGAKKRNEEATRAEPFRRSGSCSPILFFFSRPSEEATERAPSGAACELRPPTLSMCSLPHAGAVSADALIACSCQVLRPSGLVA